MRNDAQELQHQVEAAALKMDCRGSHGFGNCPKCGSADGIRIAEYDHTDYPGMRWCSQLSYCSGCSPELPALIRQWEKIKATAAEARAKAAPLRTFRRTRR